MEFKLNTSDAPNNEIEYIVDEKILANITWVELEGVMNMNHTYVSDSLRGQGIAKKLLDEAADYARTNQLKMNPICSYVVAAFEKSDAYDELKA